MSGTKKQKYMLTLFFQENRVIRLSGAIQDKLKYY